MDKSTTLGDDLLEEILMRLPVQNLLRLRCVSKHLRALIDDISFRKKHYQFQYGMHIAQKNLPLFLDSPSDDTEHPSQCYLLSKKLDDDVVLNLTPILQCDIPPNLANNVYFHCWGVVNGVICLQWGHQSVGLWNPATREFKDVRPLPDIPQKCVKILGLGFDTLSNDFKILGQVNHGGNDTSEMIQAYEMYSLKTNCWKKLREPSSASHLISSPDTDACLNGIQYWMSFDTSNDLQFRRPLILSFNLSTEVLNDFEPPEGSGCLENMMMRQTCRCKFLRTIGKYRECLALFVSRYNFEEAVCSLEIWVVTEFHDNDAQAPLSWQHLCTIGPIQTHNGLWINTLRLGGEILLTIEVECQGEQHGCIYDPSTRNFKKLGLTFGCSFTYVESLFSLSERIGQT